METLQVISGYARMISPFLAAILTAWVAYEMRNQFWCYLVAILLTVYFLGSGIFIR